MQSYPEGLLDSVPPPVQDSMIPDCVQICLAPQTSALENLDRACAFALGLVSRVSGEGRLCDLETCSLELEGTREGKSTAFFIFLFGSVF